VTIILGLPHFAAGQGFFERVDKFRQSRVMRTAQTFLEEGKKDLARGAHLRAIRLLSTAITTGADAEALKLRGQAYDLVGESGKALEDLNRYIGLRPSDPVAYMLRADIYNATFNHVQALDDYQMVLKLDPDSRQALVGSSLAHMGLEQYPVAIKEFRSLLEKDPENADLLTNLGIAYVMSDRPASAGGLFKKALEIEQDPRWRLRLENWIANLPANSDIEPPIGSEDQDQSSLREAAGSGEVSQPSMKAQQTPKELSGEVLAREGLNPRSPVPSSRGIFRHSVRSATPSDLSKATFSGNWEGTYLGARLRMQYQLSGSVVNGVLRVQSPVGKEEVYHFTGSFENGDVRASHHDGHVFRGKLTGDRHLIGTLTTADGRTIPVNLSEN